MTKKLITYVIVFAILGLVIGYFIYGKVAGEYLDPFKLVLPAKDGLHKFGRALGGIESVRNNIFKFGGIGAILGLVIGVLKKK